MNKARQFEDFILDDYDYNLLEDWDLEYLWEWVEFDDFSDLEEEFYNSQGFDPDGDSTEHTEYNSENDFLKSIGLIDHKIQDHDNNQHDPLNKQNQSNQEQEKNYDDEYEFDFNFEEDDDYDDNNDSLNHDIIENDTEGDDFLRSIGLLDDDNNQSDTIDIDDNAETDDNEEYLLGGPRYIETSQGTIDIELDDILAELQKVEFDEFIDILKNHNHVYDKILCQQEWSGEELEFLESIEPLIRQEKIVSIQTNEKKTKKQPDTIKIIDNKLINTQKFESLKEMFIELTEKALILARKNQRKIQYTPKNIPKLWNIDTQTKRENRIKLMFGSDIKINNHNTIQKQIRHTKTHNDLSNIIYGKNEIRYLELKEIFTAEIEIMTSNLDEQALNFIRQNGKRFSIQFIEFLVKKYGTKIYYLYQSQLKNNTSADILSDDLSDILTEYLDLEDSELFLEDFFEGIIITLEEKGLLF